MPSPEYLERKKQYIQKYNKRHYRCMSICFKSDSPEEMEIYEFLRSRYSTAQYIKDLVKNEMKKEGK